MVTGMDMVMAMDTDHHKNNSIHISQKRSSWIFFAFSIFSCLPVLFLFWRFSEAGLGYDIGIYRHFSSEYYKEFFNPQVIPFAFSAFSDFIFSLGDSLQSFLIGWYILLIFASTYTFGILLRKTTQSTLFAVVGLFLFSTSIIQFEFFAGFYYRNLLAIFLMFITLLLLEYKTYLAAIPLLTLSAIHPLTTLTLGPALCIVGILQKEKRKLLFSILFFAGILSVFLSWTEFSHYITTLFGFIQNKKNILAHSTEFTGQFINSSKFFRLSLPYLPFACIGFYREGKKYIFWTLFFLINLLLIVFRFFLFERFYLFLNIAILFFAVPGLLFVWEYFQNKKIFWTMIIAYSSFLFVAQIFYISQKNPLILESELKEIKTLYTIIPEKSFILSFDSSYAPWLYGFTENYKIIAPGMLDENKWNYDKWYAFWSSKDIQKRALLLSEYNTKEIYIYTGNTFEHIAKDLFSEDPNIQKLNPHLWKYHFSQ